MQKLLILGTTLFFLLFLACSTSNKDTASGARNWEDVPVKKGKSLLWKIEGNNAKPSYLFGTMHLINKEYFNFPAKTIERVTAAENVIMELGGIPNPLTAMKLMQLDTGKVYDYFTEEQMKSLLNYMETEMGITPAAFDKTFSSMKPFFLLQTISQNWFDGQPMSYDLTIMQLASEKEIPIIGLETTEQQLGFFEAIPKSDMATMIMEAISEDEKAKKEITKLMELYAAQNVDKFIPLMKKTSPEIMKFSELFLTGRNKKWIPKIETEIKTKKSFIAVGAAHLFGKEGVIDLLTERGYTLTPIEMEK